MIHLSADYLVMNHVDNDCDPVFVPNDSDPPGRVIQAIISVSDQIGNAFKTSDGSQWYVVNVCEQQEDERHPYIVTMFGTDDRMMTKDLKSLDEFYQWIQQYEFRDFNEQDVQQYIDVIC